MSNSFINQLPTVIALGVATYKIQATNVAAQHDAPHAIYADCPDMLAVNLAAFSKAAAQVLPDALKVIKANSPSKSKIENDGELEQIFNGLVATWKKETSGAAMTMRRYAHSSYQAILVLGGRDTNSVVSLILKELEKRPDMWFEALRRLTNEDPAKDVKNFDDAVKAWLDWGKKRPIIS